MKVFEVPQYVIVHFKDEDVVASSCGEDVPCKTCPGCPPGSYDCSCFDFGNE